MQPTCPKCPSTSFTQTQLTLDNLGTRTAICCKACGAIISVIDPEVHRIMNAVRK